MSLSGFLFRWFVFVPGFLSGSCFVSFCCPAVSCPGPLVFGYGFRPFSMAALGFCGLLHFLGCWVSAGLSCWRFFWPFGSVARWCVLLCSCSSWLELWVRVSSPFPFCGFRFLGVLFLLCAVGASSSSLGPVCSWLLCSFVAAMLSLCCVGFLISFLGRFSAAGAPFRSPSFASVARVLWPMRLLSCYFVSAPPVRGPGCWPARPGLVFLPGAGRASCRFFFLLFVLRFAAALLAHTLCFCPLCFSGAPGLPLLLFLFLLVSSSFCLALRLASAVLVSLFPLCLSPLLPAFRCLPKNLCCLFASCLGCSGFSLFSSLRLILVLVFFRLACSSLRSWFFGLSTLRGSELPVLSSWGSFPFSGRRAFSFCLLPWFRFAFDATFSCCSLFSSLFSC